MDKDVQTLTPPGQRALGDSAQGDQSPVLPGPQRGMAATARKPLFTAADHRRELLGAYPELAPVCDRLGFGEWMTLGEWSGSPEWALLELARAAFPPSPALSWDLASADLSELIADLIEGHHRPLRNELRRIGILIEHWSMRWGNELHVALAKRYQDFTHHLLAHLDQEESMLFPQCLAIDQARRLPHGSTTTVDEATPAIRATNADHDEMHRSLQQIRKLFDHVTRSHIDPDAAIIRIGLSEMAADLAVHATKESEFLIPAAIFAEDQVRARHGSR